MEADEIAYRIPPQQQQDAGGGVPLYTRIIHKAITKPNHVVVLPVQDSDDMSVDSQRSQTQPAPVVDVVKAHNPKHAYMRIEKKTPKVLDHHAPGWGCIYFGVILPKVQENVFQCPRPEEAQLVAIKRLSKVVVQTALRRGKRENPYQEIQLMHCLGDNHHVLGLVEALEDDHYLYIIMPYCQQESLVERIPWRRGISEDNARILFRNILENMIYLHRHGICHRDLSPDNCMVLNGRIVLTDLAMSLPIPPNGVALTGHGGFGKAAYLPPEVCLDYPFEAKGCDLWGATVTLFNLVTGEIAWTEPMPQNLKFRYLVLARGLARNPANERTVEILMDEPDGSSLRNLAQRLLDLSPCILDLLSGVLHTSFAKRWNTETVVKSAWVQNDDNWTPC